MNDTSTDGRTVVPSSTVEQSELYFVIARFLEASPCERAFKVLREELEERELLIKGKDWSGKDKSLSFEEIVKRNEHITPDFLPFLCTQFYTLQHKEKRTTSTGDCQSIVSCKSLIGNEISNCVYKNKNNTAGSILNTLTNQSYGFTNSHLTNSTPLNQCTLVSVSHLSPFSPHPLLLRQPNMFSQMKKHRVILGHLAPVFCVSFDATGQRIITGADDDLSKVWMSQTGQLMATLRGHHAELTDVSVSWDNTMIATGSLDKIVRVWCGTSSAPLAVLSGHSGHITSVKLSPSTDEDCRYLASTGKDGCLCFWKWDPESFKFSEEPFKFMEKNRVGDQTLCSDFSPGGRFFVTGGTDRIVRVYSCMEFPVLLSELTGHNDRIMSVQFSNTGQCSFATGSCDGTAIIWQYRQSQWTSTVLTLEPQTTLHSTTTSGTTSTSSRSVDHRSDGKVFPNQVTMIGWELTDTYLVTAHTPDCNVRVWRALNGKQISLLKGHSNEVFVVECHPKESRVLLTAGHDGQVIIWDMLAGVILKSFQLKYEDEGVPCIFDCKWSPDGLLCAAADIFGYLTIFGFGSSAPYEQHPDEQFFHTDYRPLMRDRNHYVVDEQTQTAPHLLPPPYLVDVDGHPHPTKHQESILQYIRRASGRRKGAGPRCKEEHEDYDEYMRKHFKVEESQKKKSLLEKHRGGGGGERGNNGDTLNESTSLNEGVVTTPTTVDPSNIQPEDLVDILETSESSQEGVGGAIEGRESIQNMLSSIVYSLGLNEGEVKEAINLWHSRSILPTLDNATISSEHGLLADVREQEGVWFETQTVNIHETPKAHTPSPTPQGRSLRSGRTILDEEYLSDLPSVRDESSEEEDSEAVLEDMWDTGSTASSDISDWTNEAGLSISNTRTARKNRRRQSAMSEMTIDEELRAAIANEGITVPATTNRRSVHSSSTTNSDTMGGGERGGERREREKKKPSSVKKTVKKGFDYSVYWPPDWLKMKSPQVSPYFPQVGDIVVYCYQGHELYRQEVSKQKGHHYKNASMPWIRYQLRPQEFCQVKNVHFVVGPPTLCSITLTLLSSHTSSSSTEPSSSHTVSNRSKPITFTFKYHDMDGVVDFLILDSIYKSSIQRVWSEGERFKSIIDGKYWNGTVVERSSEVTNSYWQCYHVRWDDGDTDQLSPWDMEEIGEGEGETSPLLPLSSAESQELAWGGEGEKERILQGLYKIMEELEEAEMFVQPVDLVTESVYCTAVPFPTDLSTITEKLKNDFYRRKLALIWEVFLLSRNASSYNEQGSIIVQHSKVLTQTLLKFIRDPECTDPMVYYDTHQIDEGGVEQFDDLTVPEVNFELESEEVFLPSSLPLPHNDKSEEEEQSVGMTTRRRKKVHISEEEEEKEERKEDDISWIVSAEQILEELCSHEDSYPFLEPVDTKAYPDYLKVISQPMDLLTVQNKLLHTEYNGPGPFIDDMLLIFTNAKNYNQSRSQVYKMATTLHSLFNKRVQQLLLVGGGGAYQTSLHNYNTRRALEKISQSLNSINHNSTSSSKEDRRDSMKEEEKEEEIDNYANNHDDSIPHAVARGSDSSSNISDASYLREELEEEEEEEEDDDMEIEEFKNMHEELDDDYSEGVSRVTRSRAKLLKHSDTESEEEEEKEIKRKRKSRKRKRRSKLKQHTNNKNNVVKKKKRKREEEYEEEYEEEEEFPPVRITRAGRVSYARQKYT